MFLLKLTGADNGDLILINPDHLEAATTRTTESESCTTVFLVSGGAWRVSETVEQIAQIMIDAMAETDA